MVAAANIAVITILAAAANIAAAVVVAFTIMLNCFADSCSPVYTQ